MIMYSSLTLGGVNHASYQSGTNTSRYAGFNLRAHKPNDLSQGIRYWIIKKSKSAATGITNKEKVSELNLSQKIRL